jgi:hypothetical protein
MKIKLGGLVQFELLTSFTDQDLSETLLGCLERCGLKIKFLQGQRYNCTLTMSGKFNGTSVCKVTIHPCSFCPLGYL